MSAWNPRYLAYCRAYGYKPEAMLANDYAKWPGGQMCGFILWHSEQLHKANKEHPEWFIDGHLVDHSEYNQWLDAEVTRLLEAQ